MDNPYNKHKKLNLSEELKDIKFYENVGERHLIYDDRDKLLIVQSPFLDKDNLKKMGGNWHPKKPKGWAWRFNIDNYNKLTSFIDFDSIDENIPIKKEMDRSKKIQICKNLADQDHPISLRIPGLKKRDKFGKKLSLYNYQKLGIQFCLLAEGGALVADSMGLGKSSEGIGTICFKYHQEKAKRILIIPPASLKYNWEQELNKWCEIDYTIINGTPEKRELQWEEKTPIKICNVELIIRDYSKVTELQKSWDLILIDEIHMIKNHKSKRTEYIKKLKTTKNGLKLGLSGTPIDGKLEDLHSIMEFLVPGLFPSKTRFLEKYAEKDFFGSIIGYKNIEEVNDIIWPYFIRRKKEDVLTSLPEKTYEDIFIELNKDEKKIYKDLISGNHEITEEDAVMTRILRARQYCDCPMIIGEKPYIGSKLAKCLEMVDEIVENGYKLIIFSMFEKMVKILLKELKKKYECLYITGEVSPKERVEISDEFNSNPKINIVIMDEAGATGLNFQEANYVIHYEDPWSPALKEQRTDRAHRATTKHNVTALTLICKDTIEERVVKALESKAVVSASSLGDEKENFSNRISLSEKELIDLI